ncbi:MAG: hypothetical protein OXI87_10385 [Albidovulum sp.]|nr:hypothetical protein [Albidovulum sp.]MDE0305276.1 hypothetical protein [Albidovulum sp.]
MKSFVGMGNSTMSTTDCIVNGESGVARKTIKECIAVRKRILRSSCPDLLVLLCLKIGHQSKFVN